MIRVVLVDDHRVVVEGLKLLLQAYPDVSVVGSAGDGAEGAEAPLRLGIVDRPVQQIAQASLSGPATNIIAGLAIGFETTGLPAVTIAAIARLAPAMAPKVLIW